MKKRNSNSGFTLIELLITLAILTLIFTGGMKLTEIFSRGKIHSDINFEVNAKVSSIKQIFANEETCNLNLPFLKGKFGSGTFSQIIDTNGNKLFPPAVTDKSNRVYIKSITAGTLLETNSTLQGKNNQIYGTIIISKKSANNKIEELKFSFYYNAYLDSVTHNIRCQNVETNEVDLVKEDIGKQLDPFFQDLKADVCTRINGTTECGVDSIIENLEEKEKEHCENANKLDSSIYYDKTSKKCTYDPSALLSEQCSEINDALLKAGEKAVFDTTTGNCEIIK